jgi:gliding motility-associated-like protein
LSVSATQVVNTIPTVSVAAPTCAADGVVTVTNYNVGFTYNFNPSGPTVGLGGVISGMLVGTTYTVSTSNAGCPLGDSAPFSLTAMLTTPGVPTITTTAPTCFADGFSQISNYDGTLTYIFSPTGPTVGVGGVISGMVTGLTYTVISNNGNCDSAISATFVNLAQLPIPAIPTISVVAPTCSSNGSATITNYVAGNTYTFTPTGPIVDGTGLVTGVTYGLSYVVSVSDGTCNSADSTPFTVDVMFITPAVPIITNNSPTCSANGSSIISNYDASLTYVFMPAGPSVDAAGLISGMVLNDSYTVTASNVNCTSGSSISFTNLPQLVGPVTPTVSVVDSEICAGETGAFQINGTPNDIIGYSINGGALQMVTLNAQGQALIEVANSVVTLTIEMVEVNNGLCINSISVSATIDVRNCTIPKGISPNNDGLNDALDLSFYNIKKLEIFNRYGAKVYSKSNYENEWYGQSDNGNELPDGTYYFVIDFTDLETKTGWIYINRER